MRIVLTRFGRVREAVAVGAGACLRGIPALDRRAAQRRYRRPDRSCV